MPLYRAALCLLLLLVCWGSALAQPSSQRPSRGVPGPRPALAETKELYQFTDSITQEEAKSVVAWVCAHLVATTREGSFQLRLPTQRAASTSPANACPATPFQGQPSLAFCSGVLVTPQIVATSATCLERARSSCGGAFIGTDSRVRAVLGYALQDGQQPPPTIPPSNVLLPERILFQSTGREQNWALIKLSRDVGNRAVPLRLDQARSGSTVQVIGHPNGFPAKVTRAPIIDNGSPASFTIAPGMVGQSPGSPVFSSGQATVEGIIFRDPVTWTCSPSSACCQFSLQPGLGTTATVIRSTAIAQALCARGQSLCGTECVNTSSNNRHCGKCGQACELPHATSTCRAGGCRVVACEAGWADCDRVASNGCEVQLGTREHCAACGDACNLPRSEEACVSRVCQVLSCEAGYGNCDGVPSNGCEARLDTTRHCGACGNTCNLQNATESCVEGVCQVLTCEPGFANCDGDASNGCEVRLGTSSDCSACGDSCQMDHAQGVCSRGRCQVGTCEAGWANCDRVASNGCEAQLGTISHCAACGNTCNLAHAEEACVGGSCLVASCAPGFANCDNNPANGCEVRLGTTSNCSACGASCAQLPNTIPSCLSGTCQWACKAGWSDCTDSPGCETRGNCPPTCSPATCNDNNACTTDSCSADGRCTYSQLGCDDGNPCTDDSCTPSTGCANTPRTGAACGSDGNACTQDVCSSSGQCTHPLITCNDSNACTTDSCNSSTGCTYTPIACNDSNACTTDSCNSSTGCTYTPITCNDSNACTTDSCNSSTGCTHTTITCNDGNICTVDSCNSSTGCTFTPQPGTPCLSDGNACTQDVCDGSGQCSHPTLSCNDNNECTTDTCNSDTGCRNTPITCDDNNECTTNSCNPSTGCTYTWLSCNDNDPCTTDHCSGGNCHYTGICEGYETCSEGLCSCPSPYYVCNNTCTDIQGDPNNCGGCDNRCPNGTICHQGSCCWDIGGPSGPYLPCSY